MKRSMTLLAMATLLAFTSEAQEDHSHHRPAQAPPAGAGHEQHGDPAHHHAHPPAAAASGQPTQSEMEHVPPDPPEHPMHDMSNEEMIELMGMDDSAPFGMLLADQIEWRDTDDGSTLAWDASAWYGNDYDKLWLKSEGERSDGETQARTELLWDHVFARWWNVQAGVRHDASDGPSRTWAAVGVQGLAPHWFEVEATLYVGEQGRTAARFSGEYEVLLTQRLILQPEIDFELYGRSDVRNGIGSGLAESELAVRLRYEVRRELAPYVGVVWSRMYGQTADLARAAGHDASKLQLVAGLRAWF